MSQRCMEHTRRGLANSKLNMFTNKTAQHKIYTIRDSSPFIANSLLHFYLRSSNPEQVRQGPSRDAINELLAALPSVFDRASHAKDFSNVDAFVPTRAQLPYKFAFFRATLTCSSTLLYFFFPPCLRKYVFLQTAVYQFWI